MNIKNTTRPQGRKPVSSIYCLQSLEGQFCSTQFLISFEIVSRNEFIYFYRKDFLMFEGFNGGWREGGGGTVENIDTLCWQKVSYLNA